MSLSAHHLFTQSYVTFVVSYISCTTWAYIYINICCCCLIVWLFLLKVPVLLQQTVAEVILELSSRPRIQEARLRRKETELATLLTASPYKRFLENKEKITKREVRKQREKESYDTEESCGPTEKKLSRFQIHNIHPKRRGCRMLVL